GQAADAPGIRESLRRSGWSPLSALRQDPGRFRERVLFCPLRAVRTARSSLLRGAHNRGLDLTDRSVGAMLTPAPTAGSTWCVAREAVSALLGWAPYCVF